jgi:hypothetical protein
MFIRDEIITDKDLHGGEESVCIQTFIGTWDFPCDCSSIPDRAYRIAVIEKGSKTWEVLSECCTGDRAKKIINSVRENLPDCKFYYKNGRDHFFRI